jgi:hypothetical protein
MLNRAGGIGILLLALMACQRDVGQDRRSDDTDKQALPQNHQEETVTQTPQLVALVWMRSADGDQGAAVDAPADLQQTNAAVAFFRERGFEVTEPQSGQFSIVGPQGLFVS